MVTRDQAELMQRASLAVLLQAAAAPDSAAGKALSLAMTGAADITFREVVQEASMSRDRFLGLDRKQPPMATQTGSPATPNDDPIRRQTAPVEPSMAGEQ